MKTEKMIALLVERRNCISTSTHALGGGEWSIEIRCSATDDFLFELVGNNGTRNNEEADDLWGELDELQNKAALKLKVAEDLGIDPSEILV